jgi:hypothetical protein
VRPLNLYTFLTFSPHTLQRHIYLWDQVYTLCATRREEPKVRPAKDTEFVLSGLSSIRSKEDPRKEERKYQVVLYGGEKNELKRIGMYLHDVLHWPTFRVIVCAHIMNFEAHSWWHWCCARSHFMRHKYIVDGVKFCKLEQKLAESLVGQDLNDSYSEHPLFELYFQSVDASSLVSDNSMALF